MRGSISTASITTPHIVSLGPLQERKENMSRNYVGSILSAMKVNHNYEYRESWSLE